ncbi:MAG: TonB-dependent receptor [Deltaproteobacteria bacterium]|nr:TonB-dependent receptor [Deltaproteobacteria bacterium]
MRVLLALAPLLVAQTLTKAPELVEGDPPAHPEAFKDCGAAITLAIVVDDGGLVSRVDVTTAALDETPSCAHAGSSFAVAAMGAAASLVFLPAEVDGLPASVAITQTLTFIPDVITPPQETTTTTTTARAAEVLTDARGRLSGRVRAMGTVVPLPAELRVSSNRSVEEKLARAGIPGYDDDLLFDADDDGRFALVLAEGPWHLEVSCTGHEPRSVDVFIAGGGVEVVDFALRPRVANAAETVVRAQRRGGPVSRVSLSRAEVTGIPGTYGDALRVVESVPGVARAPLLGGALMVRGGLPADTQVMIEGVSVPTLYHFGGFRSVLNGAFVEELAFMPGGFPARYGNATAGVVDVTSRALRDDPFVASFSLDLLDVGFFFGGTAKLKHTPFGDTTLPDVRVGLAARRSHTELPAHLALGAAMALQQPLPFVPAPSWYDWQFKLESDVADDVTLLLLAFGAEDQFAFLGEPPDVGLPEGVDVDALLNSLLGNQFTRVLGRVTWRPVRGVTHTLQPYLGSTKRGLLAEGVVVPLLSGDFFSPPQEQTEWGLRDETRVCFFPWLELRAGLDVQRATTKVQRLSEPALDTPDLAVLADVAISAAGVWADVVVDVGGLTVIPGIRTEVSSVRVVDEKPIFEGKHSSVADGTFFDPRVQLRYRFGSLLTVKGAFGSFHQRPRLQAVGFDVDGDELAHPQALHLVFGIESELSSDLTLDAQVYGVRRVGFTRDRTRRYRSTLAVAGSLPSLGSFDSFGSGETEGFELMLRSKPRVTRAGSFFGWIAYTLSRTVTSLGDTREPVSAAAFDQTHNLVAVGKVALPWDLTAGARFAIVTGNPGPIPDSIATQHDVGDNDYWARLSSLQSARLPPFHRLDLRVEQTWVFDWGRVTPFVEVLNVYNWMNPEVLYPSGDYRQRELRVLVPGPPTLPLVGLEMTL